MKRWKTEAIQVRLLFLGMVLLLIAILLPLFWISFYNFKSAADDYGYAANVVKTWQDSHSVLKVLENQTKDTWNVYQTWQGSFVCHWFTSIMLGVFGESAYFLSTFMTLGSLVLAELLLFMVILVKGLGADKYRAAIASISCIIVQVLWTPYPVEAYFWFCGSLIYTFFYALALVLLCLWYFLSQKKGEVTPSVVGMEIGIVLLSIAVAAGNYITALPMLIIYAFYTAWMLRKKPYKIMSVCNMLLYLVTFGLSVMAPGNYNRQDAAGAEKVSAVGTVFLALKEAAEYIIVNANPPCVIVGLLLIPIFIGIVKKKNYRYPFPLFVSVLSFGIYASEFVPSLYALQILGAGRVINLYRLNLYVLLYANELYWIGWLWRRHSETLPEDVKTGTDDNGRISYLLPGWIVGGLLLCLAAVPWGGQTLTTVSAIQSLRSGEAKQYRQEYEERRILLEDPNLKEVYLKPYSVAPYLLNMDDVKEDTEHWVNKSVANYYGKDAVGLQK